MVDVVELRKTLNLSDELVAALCVDFLKDPHASVLMLEEGYMTKDDAKDIIENLGTALEASEEE